jgi:hypothetical protein
MGCRTSKRLFATGTTINPLQDSNLEAEVHRLRAELARSAATNIMGGSIDLPRLAQAEVERDQLRLRVHELEKFLRGGDFAGSPTMRQQYPAFPLSPANSIGELASALCRGIVVRSACAKMSAIISSLST